SRTGMPRGVASILYLRCCRRQGDRSERAALTETPTYCPDDRRRLDKYASAVVLVAVCILTGCTPVSLTDTHITGTPQPQSFNTDERVAALDVIAPANLQEFAPVFSNALLTALEQTTPPIRAMSFQESGNLLNDRGLAADYADLVSGFLRSGILERERLRRIGGALGSRYVLVPGVAAFDQTVIARFDLAR